MTKGWIGASVLLIITMAILVVFGVIFFNAWFNPTSGLSITLENAAQGTMDAGNLAWYSTFLDNQEWFYGLVFVVCAGVSWVIYIVYSTYGTSKGDRNNE